MSKKKKIKPIKIITMSKALELMKANKSVEERSDAYVVSIERDLRKEMIDTLIEKQEKIADQMFELTNFTLDTDANKGLAQMSKEVCKDRFKKIINLEYEATLIAAELKVRQASFDKYFKENGKA